MTKWLSRAGTLLAVATLSASMAVAAPGKDKTKKTEPTCPVCKMTLSSKKTDKTPNAVKVGKKTYYCCGCDMTAYKNKKGAIVLKK